ncbi:MAG: hypothetical protein LQ348_005874 [Seirophora lacunosa]|nr:MAG: hypothetical protein LQ348_005874 [Seirophora lacunosa]
MEARASGGTVDPAPAIELVSVVAGGEGSTTRQCSSTSHRQAESSRRPMYQSRLQTWWASNVQPTIVSGANGSPSHHHDPRDYLALERTYLAHWRTASALVLLGVVGVQLFRLHNAESAAGVVFGAVTAGGGIVIVLAGGRRYFLLQKKLIEGKMVAGWVSIWIDGIVILGVIVAVLVVILVDAYEYISPGAKSKVKSSVQRAIRTKITETYPLLAPHIDEIIPKKSQLDLLKLPDRITLYALGTTPLFFQHMDDPLIPHLRIVHQFPSCFPRIRIDRGAIRFVLSGATLMAPGLTSAGGRLPTGEPAAEDADESDKRYEGRELNEGEVVVVEAEGKDEACMIGQLRVGTREVKEKKKGVVIDTGHYLGDGLWKMVLD